MASALGVIRSADEFLCRSSGVDTGVFSSEAVFCSGSTELKILAQDSIVELRIRAFRPRRLFGVIERLSSLDVAVLCSFERLFRLGYTLKHRGHGRFSISSVSAESFNPRYFLLSTADILRCTCAICGLFLKALQLGQPL